MLERCLEVKEEPEMVVGEKAATVGGRAVEAAASAPPSWADVDGAMESIHGRSSTSDEGQHQSSHAKREGEGKRTDRELPYNKERHRNGINDMILLREK